MRLEIVAAIVMAFTILACVLGTNVDKNFLGGRFFDGNNVLELRVVEVDASPSTSTGTLLDEEDDDFFFIVAERRRMLRDRSAGSVSTIA